MAQAIIQIADMGFAGEHRMPRFIHRNVPVFMGLTTMQVCIMGASLIASGLLVAQFESILMKLIFISFCAMAMGIEYMMFRVFVVRGKLIHQLWYWWKRKAFVPAEYTGRAKNR